MSTTIGIAIDIPSPWGELLTRRRIVAGDPAGSQVPAHLTLLGPTVIDADQLPTIDSYLESIATAQPPFVVRLRGAGTFRPVTEVVYVEVAEGAAVCRQLAAAMQAAPGITAARFPYHPHVTVAQNVSADALDAVTADLADFDAEFTVPAFTLFEHATAGSWRPDREYQLGGLVGART